MANTHLERSPYTGDICEIFFQGQGPINVPKHILGKCPKLASRLSEKWFLSKLLDIFNVEDITFEVGHIVIHFLTTGTYQCLKRKGHSEDERKSFELSTAFNAYATALTLELPSLPELAEAEMVRLEQQMSLNLIAWAWHDSNLTLDKYPTLMTHIRNHIFPSFLCLSKEDIDNLVTRIGTPRNILMAFIKHMLDSYLMGLEAQVSGVTGSQTEHVAPSSPFPGNNSSTSASPSQLTPTLSEQPDDGEELPELEACGTVGEHLIVESMDEEWEEDMGF
ncbi:hypothetical protein NW762_010872 [Fusarium torreyae]|uniref:Uncharacterized protein n=1 Tax=Fusarium torreyae TaxID=1237075 RepID=A0A9W8VDB0_9HYPO|nr:hypothetical protein NW762_010872 [Fusarium torreyae]